MNYPWWPQGFLDTLLALHGDGQRVARNQLDTELFGCISAMVHITYLTVNTKLDVLWRILWAVQRQEEVAPGVLVAVSPSRSLAEDLLTTFAYVVLSVAKCCACYICVVE